MQYAIDIQHYMFLDQPDGMALAILEGFHTNYFINRLWCYH